MVSLEGLEELKEDLFFRLFTRENIRVGLGRVDTLDVVDVDPAIAVTIEFIVSLTYKLLAGGAQGSSDATKELIVVNGTAAVVVEISIEGTDL